MQSNREPDPGPPAPSRPGLAARIHPDRLLLRSRFGRRLLLIFLASALLPTLVVAGFSLWSARAQLSEQIDERLQAEALATGQAIYERLSLLEGDLREAAGSLRECLGSRPDAASCVDGLAYALTAAALVTPDRPLVPLSGKVDSALARRAITRAGLPPGQSALVSLGSDGDVLLGALHRSADGQDHVVGLIDPAYLWGPRELDGRPGSTRMVLWEPTRGGWAPLRGDTLVVGTEVQHRMGRSATGAFRWEGAAGRYRAGYWSFPSTRRLRLPPWRLVISLPEAEVYAPMTDFARTLPPLLAALLLGVTAFGLRQVRRRVFPLEALHEGTRRIARQDFATPVAIESGDEIEELADSFNAMAATVHQQFRSLRVTAEAERAVLSCVDRTEIAETALRNLPRLVACEAMSLVLLDPGEDTAATLWSGIPGASPHDGEPGDDGRRAVTLAVEELTLLRVQHDRVVLAGNDPALPAFCAPLRARGGGTAIEIYPLRFGDEVHGALAVCRAGADGDVDDAAVHLRRFADQVAVALGNARMVERVRFLAFYDNLTGLPNRVLYKERLGQALLRAERRRCHVALCFLDLDQFSTINDSLGHDLGDALIEQVAARLLTVCRDSDTIARLGGDPSDVEVARLGGDEFTVVLPDLVDPQDASRVARRLLQCFREPFRLGTHEVFVSTSIGVAVYPEDGRDIDNLLKNADVAMYHAKEQGRNTYRMYSASMNAEAVARMQLEQQLRRAVEGGEFTLAYQPIIELASGRIAGAEALVRWNHPERGLVSPAEFIALSEESGLIVRLGEWILQAVCEQAVTWRAPDGPVYAAVNLSARQLQDQDIVDAVRRVLAETGLEPRRLVLELTESVLMEPEGQVASSIRALADLGVRFAIDDFGTGYSSLSYLKHFPVDTLKIDQTFVRHVAVNPDDSAIASAIVALGRALELEVVAEGVETEEQARFLAELGCHKMQGFLVGQPVDAAGLQVLLAAGLPLRFGARSAEPAIPAR